MTDHSRSAENPQPIDFGRLSLQQGFRLVVVGSNGGIGSALCQNALALGADVVGLDTAAAIAERPLPGKVWSLPVDVLDPTSIATAFTKITERFSQIDGLVYVSGIGERPMAALAHSAEQWDRTQDVNLRGAFLAAKAAAPILQPFAGSIVFISSGLAVNVEPGFAAYSASKAGLIAFAKVLAKELAPAVRVNVVAPGLVLTPFLAGGTGSGAAEASASVTDWFGSPERGQAMRDAIPLKRIAVPDDIVAPIFFLLGSGARFVTGQTLHINGGRYLP
ncbi:MULTISPECIES: SDR family oxidoreductase [unclassified Beijerinckia]|uniref:SDR family NAD(P)-dependent oxidoreductase n=1 Tax=unclassified Beijerinckia TaxID=2638183 RepID=UPI00089ACBE8|nr:MULTISPECIES: SDR family oxidoreductase [unclassified Beijerinckia]MDH7799727.1 3-oxoacyl-[acyl-carrier protein] reductase [Beijerinckia sp. GAS462]SED35077.1 3-oxoacyl-[acyl-carrier protein] reductase [Beijerinckia sp. 28-YEA-48]